MYFFAVLILSLCSVAFGDPCANVRCPPVPKHYEELECKPVVQPGQCCAHSFDCSQLYKRDPNKCHYKGRTYNINEYVEDPDFQSSCRVSCRCTKYYHDEPAKIDCAHIDCPEFFGPEPARGQNCIAQYKQDGCCKERDVCGGEVRSLSRCTFEGKNYYLGQQIHPDSCYSCWCGPGFEDRPAEQNRYCKKINCGIDISYGNDIIGGCVPVYYKKEDCCPIDKRCPDNNTKVIKTKNAAQGGPQCFFGQLKLSIGDSLTPSNNCVSCTCTVPPYVTCIQTC